MNESCRITNPILKVLGQATVPIEPRERAFNDPAFGQSDEAFHLITACDNLYGQLWPYLRYALTKLRPLISAVRKQFGQPRKALGQRREQRNPAVLILYIGGLHDRLQEQAQGIN